MARMIPPGGTGDGPLSETRVYEMLRSDPGTRAWTVYHSQGLSSAYTGHYGEADFIAVLPGRGLVCIEVKGGGVRCENGAWFSTARDGQVHQLKRSPALQAQQTVHKLRASLVSRFGRQAPEATCPIGWMVIFTDADAPPPSPEFARSEVIDRNDLVAQPVARLEACPSLQREIERFGAPSPAVLQSIQKFLRPDFDRVETLSTSLWEAERRLLALTDEQYGVLDHVMDNASTLVHGGAGTGKTLLAVELARRLAGQGRAVILTCFNRELGLWLEKRAGSFGPGRVVAGNLHRLLRPAVEASGLTAPDPFGPAWYEAAALAIAEGSDRFDTVIVDEAQDFPVECLVAIAEQWTEGSAAEPRICLFADYSRQALYGDAQMARARARERVAGASLPLKINCRNTRRITAETELLTGSYEIRPVADAPEGPTVDRIFYSDGQERQALEQALRNLRADGLAPEEIVILSPRRRENSSLAGIESAGGFRIIDREDRDRLTGVAFSTIHAFKGLESKAVVLIDLEPGPDAESDALIYVGMTRARARLSLVLHQRYRDELDRRTRANLQASVSREAV